MAGRFEAFPYPVQEVRGSLDLTVPGDRPPRLDVDLTAEAAGRRPVTIQGWVEGDAPAPGYDITVSGDAITLDAALIGSLPAKFQDVARSYHPQGRCDITAHLSRTAGEVQPNQRYTGRLPRRRGGLLRLISRAARSPRRQPGNHARGRGADDAPRRLGVQVQRHSSGLRRCPSRTRRPGPAHGRRDAGGPDDPWAATSRSTRRWRRRLPTRG